MVDIDDAWVVVDNADRIAQSKSKAISKSEKAEALEIRNSLDTAIEQAEKLGTNEITIEIATWKQYLGRIGELSKKIRNTEPTPTGVNQQRQRELDNQKMENAQLFSIAALGQALRVASGRLSLSGVHPNSKKVVEDILNRYDEDFIGKAYEVKYKKTQSRRRDFMDQVKNSGSLAMIRQNLGSMNPDSVDPDVMSMIKLLLQNAKETQDKVLATLSSIPFVHFDERYKKAVYKYYKKFSDLMRNELYDLVTAAANKTTPHFQNYRNADEFADDFIKVAKKTAQDFEQLASGKHAEVPDDFISSTYRDVFEADPEVPDEPIEEVGEPLSVDSFREKIQSTLRNAFRN